MRNFVFIAALVLASCANLSSPGQNQPVEIKNGLSAQKLDIGECGIFLWTLSKPPNFVFFQKNGDESAKLFSGNQEHILQPVSPTDFMNDFGAIHNQYLTDTKQKIIVKGKYGDEMDDGRKISTGSIQITKPDGWQEIIPVSGVYGCTT